jgi:hypothetical protein
VVMGEDADFHRFAVRGAFDDELLHDYPQTADPK